MITKHLNQNVIKVIFLYRRLLFYICENIGPLKGNSIVYRNLIIYRMMMNLLYKGQYKGRFDVVCKLIKGNNVVELCFGDTLIAEYCKKNNIEWMGMDINKNFVEHAKGKGFNVELQDLNLLSTFPAADTYIITGSLYHFHAELEKFLNKILAYTSTLIISEPVNNLSSRNGLIGKVARYYSTVNGDEHGFRYSEKSIVEALNKLSLSMGF